MESVEIECNNDIVQSCDVRPLPCSPAAPPGRTLFASPTPSVSAPYDVESSKKMTSVWPTAGKASSERARKASFAQSEHAPSSRKASLTGRQSFCLGDSMPLSRATTWFETQQAMDAQYPTPPHLTPRRGSNTSERRGSKGLQRGLSFWNGLTGGTRLERAASDPHGKHGCPASEPQPGKHVRVHPSVPSTDAPRHNKEALRRKASSEQAALRADSLRLQQEAVRRHLMPLEREREEPALLRRYFNAPPLTCAAASDSPQLTLTTDL